MRTGSHPVLMVNAVTTAPYESVLLAIDASEASYRAVDTAKSLGFLDGVQLSVISAFEPVYKGMLDWAGVEVSAINEYSESWANETRVKVGELLRQAGLQDGMMQVLTEDGPPFVVIKRAVARFAPQLLVIGTHGRTGIKRALIGSVAEQVINQAECDVLVVPSRLNN
jgi:nucleotide-binding universal stress UspA family protein